MPPRDPHPASRHLLEELRNVVGHYPLFPGDTLSHATAKACAERGWIRRNTNGDWIPTADGLSALEHGHEH